ncbi:MAG: glycosyltransferase family 1 protein [Phycisphaerae bacterium]
MRIGINACPLRVSGGGARYVFTELLEHLLEIDDQNEYVIFAQFEGLSVLHQVPRIHQHLFPGRAVRGQVRLIEVASEQDILQYRDEFDLFFGPLNNLQPRIYDRPSVAILHDIQEQYFPQFFSEADLLARREIYPEICRSATVLVAISEYCKQTFIDKFEIEPDKIRVIYNAPQAGLVSRSREDPGAWRREPLPSHYLLYTANCYQHKNHRLLLDALVRLREMGVTPPVVFVGFELCGGFPLRKEIEARRLGAQCRTFEQVSVDELRHLYFHARAFVMPTLFEGFGIPAIEALSCGCPVICSDIPALREICGSTAQYFDPARVESLVDSIRLILDDEERRREMREAGYRLAADFTWPRAARQMLACFEESARRFFAFDPTDRDAAGRLPRIGVVVRAQNGAWGVPEAIKNVMAAGYPHAFTRVLLPDGLDNTKVRAFLESAGVEYEQIPSSEMGRWASLRRFAESASLDLVAEVLAGHNRLTATAFHSLAGAFLADPSKVLYLGEAWEVSPSGAFDTARLRRTGDGLVKIHGFVYPEMAFVNSRRLEDWPEGRAAVEAAGAEWRWVLTKEAHRSGRLQTIRRTLAVCNGACVSLLSRYRAARDGSNIVESGNGKSAPGGWLVRFKPMLRPVSRVLPGRLREQGRRVWKHLTHGA